MKKFSFATSRPFGLVRSLVLALAPLVAAAQVPAERLQSAFRTDLAATQAATKSPVAAALLRYSSYSAPLADLRTALAQAPLEKSAGSGSGLVLALPLPEGGMTRFRVFESPIMEPSLAKRLPLVHTYVGIGLDDPTATLRCDVTPKGFHAQVLAAASGAFYVEPAALGDVTHYLSFYRHDVNPAAAIAQRLPCVLPADAAQRAGHPAPSRSAAGPLAARSSGSTLRIYRLALAATAEYVAARGGTVASAQASMVTSVNRVVGVYEKELAVRLILINNTALIHTNAATDPYTNADGNAMLAQNQTSIDQVVGDANYDIGHVFSTGGGGIALIGAVSQGTFKAQGVTGAPNPVGDAFDIDFVAHEMGHQFGANHPFNAESGECGFSNRNPGTAFEPGSGSTIMAYAGICGSIDNLQKNSDPYFNAVSYDEIQNYIAIGGFPNATLTSGNAEPTVTLPALGTRTLPRFTPFKLTATAADANNDALLFCWEETDLGTAASVNAAQVVNNAVPLFRSRVPVASATRFFPKLGTLTTPPAKADLTERLPTVARALSFRCTVRDRALSPTGNGAANGIGGVANTAPLVLAVSAANAAAFAVTAPATALTWTGNSTQTVTWNVVGTNLAPVSCATVNVLLSTDGGVTYPVVLAAGAPNSGTARFTVPNNVTTAKARVMVEAADNYFFNISRINFTVKPGAARPVKLVALTAKTEGTAAVRIAWVTASEENSDQFEIERSLTGTAFERIATSASRGGSASAHTYTLRDALLPAGTSTLYYRLRQIDRDGTVTYSPVVTVALVPAVEAAQMALFPNPATGTTTLTGTAPGTVVQVLDMRGRPVAQTTADAAGSATLVLPQGLFGGVYVVRAGSKTLRLAVE